MKAAYSLELDRSLDIWPEMFARYFISSEQKWESSLKIYTYIVK